MSFDKLTHFRNWYLKNAGALAFVPFDSPSHMIDGVTAVTMYRKGEFQVQMFVVPPGHIIPEHTHPNVDSYEIYVGGDIKFSLGGKWVDGDVVEGKHGLANSRGVSIRVHPDSPHGGVFPRGGVFLSVQRWLNGVQPSCVSSDYVGAVMGPQHMARVTTGVPVLKTSLTATDAASGEG